MTHTLYPGDTHASVGSILRPNLRRVGFDIGCSWLSQYVLNAPLERVVRTFQMDAGLVVDGIVGPKTWGALLAAETGPLPDCTGDTADWDRDMPGLFTGVEMIPQYGGSDIDAWARMEYGSERDYIVPLPSDGSGHHGATCGHAAWLLTSWWAGVHRPEAGEPITWRTGRGPTKSMPLRFLPLASLAGVMYGGKIHRGCSELMTGRERVKDLRDVRHMAPGWTWNICQRDSGHVVCTVQVDTSWCPVDPRTGLPMRHGMYRLAADGSKATTGRPWTFRRMGTKAEIGPWTCYGIGRLDDRGAGRLRLE